MFALSAVFHYPIIFFITYSVMILHEIAHLIAAVCIGLKIDYIAFLPFGVNLRLKNKMVYSIADEIILYISGPLVNAFFAVFAALFYRYCPYYLIRMFYISNIMLFIMNLLPALPLDGGIITRKILMYRYGFRNAEKIMKIISAVISAAVTALGIYAAYKTHFNYSVLLFSLLLIGNIFTRNEKYNIDFIKELMFHNKKGHKRVRHIITDEKRDYKSIAEDFRVNCYNVVYRLDESGRVTEILTETQVINQIMDSNITVY